MLNKANNQIWLIGLASLLVLSVIISTAIGPVEIKWIDLLGLLNDDIGSENSLNVLIDIRLPRVLSAVVIGAALGLSGALTQALFRNPLADPALLGITSGAGLAIAMLMIVIPLFNQIIDLHNSILQWSYSVAAFLGAVCMCQILLWLSRLMSLVSISSLLLCGLALNALASALIGICIYLANDQQLRTFTFWTLGSLSGVTWGSFWILSVGLGLGIVMVLRLAPQLNALAMGDGVAKHLGVNLPRIRFMSILCVALLCGLCVAVSGVIGFISLIAPQMIRVLIGSDHRMVLPTSMLTGAVLLVIADTLSKNLASPTEMPVGIFTALIGAPYFLYLLSKKSHQEVH